MAIDAAFRDVNAATLCDRRGAGCGAAIGASAIREAERFSFDLCFLGTCAASVSLGLGAFQLADAEFKRTLIASSERVAAWITLDKIETSLSGIESCISAEYRTMFHDG